MSGPHDPVQTVLDALSARGYKAAKSGAGFRAQCPAHAGKDRNLKIDAGDDGRALLSCKVHGCTAENVVTALGLTLADLFPDGPERPHTRVPITPNGPAPQREPAAAPGSAERSYYRSTPFEAEYEYCGPDGELRYIVRRYDNPKTFRPFVPGIAYSTLTGAERVPYRLPQLVASHGLVIVTEGEKDVHALERLGFVATCNDGGAGKWKPEHARYLEGRDVAIIPDNDKAGIGHAHSVAATFQGIARSVKVLDPLPGVPDKGDPFDWIEAGGSADELRALIAAAPEWQPGETEATGPRLELVSLADVQPREVDWYWRNWLARGKLHILAGHPGDGKSTLTAWLSRYSKLLRSFLALAR